MSALAPAGNGKKRMRNQATAAIAIVFRTPVSMKSPCPPDSPYDSGRRRPVPTYIMDGSRTPQLLETVVSCNLLSRVLQDSFPVRREGIVGNAGGRAVHGVSCGRAERFGGNRARIPEGSGTP